MRVSTTLASVGVSLGLSACAPREIYSSDQAPEYMTQKTAAFYKNGPAQAGAPEEIPPLTYVLLLQKGSDGYSVVRLPDGRSGYVESDQIRKAPPAARAVSEEQLFPERMADPLPEPDFSAPVEEVATVIKPKPKARRP